MTPQNQGTTKKIRALRVHERAENAAAKAWAATERAQSKLQVAQERWKAAQARVWEAWEAYQEVTKTSDINETKE